MRSSRSARATSTSRGDGCVDARGFDGWIVVEQDVLNGPDVSLSEFRSARGADQIRNREALRPWA